MADPGKNWKDGVWAPGVWAEGVWSQEGDEPQPPDFTGVGHVGGTSVSATGVMGTAYLADGAPVPAGAVWINGFAHSPTGMRYVCPWPASGKVYYDRGIARRADGAMCIALAAAVDCVSAGWALTERGEVIVSIDTPQVVHGGFGLLQTGVLCVSEAA